MPERRLWAGVLILLLVPAFFLGVHLRVRVQPGTGAINPEAKIDPFKHYTLTFWDFDRPVSGREGLYREELEAAVNEFTRRFPNVTVRIELLDWLEGEKRIEAALRQGEPPDVLATGPLGRVSFGPLQVPWTPYAGEEELSRYAGAALIGVRDGDQLVAWPRWLALPLWAANRDLLTAAGVPMVQIQEQGWTWTEFAAAGGRLQETSPEQILFTSLDLVSLWGELKRGLPSGVENPVLYTAERALQLRESGTIPHRIGLSGYAGLEDFFSGRVACFGPVEPWFMRAVHERSERVELGILEPVGGSPFAVSLVPPPGVGEGGLLPLRQEVLVVFRQRRYQGDNHTRLAMELARHLSQSAGVLGAYLDLVPAYGPAQEVWLKEWRVGEGMVLLRWLEYATPEGVLPQDTPEERERLEELLRQLWEGNLSAADLAAELD